MNKNNLFILALIILLAVFLRFYNLGRNPPSLTWDEAAWGYNAYSLGIDGRDEFGRFLPHDYLESFGDFKPPVYAYLSILPVKIFGLTEFSTRFASAFFGVLTVLITYFLAKILFHLRGVHSATSEVSKAENIALLSAFFLAISPWHIMLSRAAFEANVATFFIVCAVWLFLGGVQEKKWYLLLSAVSFVLSLYTFNTARVVAPILVLVLAIGFRKQLFKRKKQTVFAFVIGILLILPTLKFFLSPQANLRFQEVNIFSDINIIKTTNQEIANDNNAEWSKIIHNRRLAYGVEYLKHYFDNFNPSFLFIKGDGNPKFSTQTVGEMYLWDLPFFVIGILFLFRKREGNWWIIPMWLILGIIPAATARETPHALRIETTLPTFQIITAYGFLSFVKAISNIKYQKSKMQIKYLIFALSFLFLIFNFLYFYHDYFTHYPIRFSGEWQYGYREAIGYVKSVEHEYDRVIVTEDLGRPYIYFLFYTRYDPKRFRSEAIITREAFGFVHIKSFGKYRFGKKLNEDNNSKKALYVNIPQQVPQNAKILKTFDLLNGNPSLVVYE